MIIEKYRYINLVKPISEKIMSIKDRTSRKNQIGQYFEVCDFKEY